MKRSRGERGQALIFACVSIVTLFSCMAVAVDVGLLYGSKRAMQTAADAGAIAGALELNYKSPGYVTAARTATAQNGFTNGSGGTTVTVNSPPANGSFKGVSGYVEVIVSQSQPTFFADAFGWKGVTVAARSVADAVPSQFCVYLLGNVGGVRQTWGLLNSGLIDILDFPNCGIVDDAGISNSGFLSINASYVGVVGSVSGGPSITPAPVTIAPFTDPLSYLPQPSTAGCGAAKLLAGTQTVTNPTGKVCWDGLTFSPGANITFSPGLYIINGPVNLAGAGFISGTGVTFFFNNTFTFSGLTILTLSAPTTGTYNGILFFESRADSNPVKIQGANLSILKGIIYLPNAALDISDIISGIELYDPLVVGQLTDTCLICFTVNFQNYNSVNASNPLVQAKLAE